MPKANYVQNSDIAFNAQLQTFNTNLGAYAGVLGLSSAQTGDSAADSTYLNYILQCQQAMQNGAQQWTVWKDLARDGGTMPATGAPAALTLPPPVAAVDPGIEVRFRALVQLIKASPAYNESMGEALGIEGAMQTGPDLTTVQPAISAVISGGTVNVKWGWQGNVAYLDICEIQVDRGSGFALLTFDTTPGYTDTQPFPAAPAKWTYKAIYRVNDAQVGLWSNPVTITVPQ
jgi:hypothetical protein